MTTPKWKAGNLYLPGDLVQPITKPSATSTVITNASFETGDATGWTLGSGMSVVSGDSFAGTYNVECAGTGGVSYLVHDSVNASPGQSITASCMYQQGGASAGNNVGAVVLRWLDVSDALIREDLGSLITSGKNDSYNRSTVTATAPAGTAKVQICGRVDRNVSNTSRFDTFTWNYAYSTIPPGLIYKAVQPDPGTSASTEPAWPTTLGVTVVDGGVVWEAMQASRVAWEASPILKSGATEPTWPTTPGEFVSDGTIAWECVSRRIEDENCPNSKIVAIVAGKVFAGDGDIVRYCASGNPLDWTTEHDAGFLPTGLQQANSNSVAVLNQYRGNLTPFNASSFQMWQADPDPTAMAILDQMDGIGSEWQQAACPVANDLFYLSQLGVRSVGIANAAENLSAGDVGMPIDVLVQSALAVATAAGDWPISTYYPSAGQYWLTFPDYPAGLSISGDLPDDFVGEFASGAYTSAGGEGAKTYAVTSGALPPGISLAPNGQWSGQHLGGGNGNPYWDYTWDVTVTDSNGSTATLTDTCRVTNFSINGDLPDGNLGDVVTGAYTNAHGVEPISYDVALVDFPAGFVLDSDGSYAGEYVEEKAWAWQVVATDAAGNIATLDDDAMCPAPDVTILAAPDGQTYIAYGDGASLPDTANTGISSGSSECMVDVANGLIFHWKISGEMRYADSLAGPWSSASGLPFVVPSGVIYTGTEYLAFPMLYAASTPEYFEQRSTETCFRPMKRGNTILGFTGASETPGAVYTVSVDNGASFMAYAEPEIGGGDKFLCDAGDVFVSAQEDAGGTKLARSPTGLQGTWTVSAGPGSSYVRELASDGAGGVLLVLDDGSCWYSTDSAASFTEVANMLVGTIAGGYRYQRNGSIFAGGYYYCCVNLGGGSADVKRWKPGDTEWTTVYSIFGGYDVNSVAALQ